MKTLINILGILIIIVFMVSCSGGKSKRKPIYVEVEYPTEEIAEGDNDIKYAKTGDEVAVPFTMEGGVKIVDVWVNGIGVKMIFDTGCSYTLISAAEADYLYTKGMLTQDDFLGTGKSRIADGSIVENMVVNLKEVVIDGKIPFYNVVATVSNNDNAPLLLGNEVLDRVATVTVDNENKTINFKIK